MADLQRELTKPVIEIQNSDEDDDQETVQTPQADAAEASCFGVSVWQTLLNEPAPANTKFGGIRKAAQQRQSDVERRLLKTFQIEHRMNEALRARKTFSDVCRIVHNTKVVTSVKRQDLPDLKVSYRDQGNLDMYTAANLKKRDANRHHPEVIEALDEFWNILPKLPNGKINKAIYSWMYRKMYFQMVKSASEIEFQNVVAEDWRQDALFGNYMNIRMFRQAIFNTADVWCETLEPEEYRDFIRHLRKVVEAGQPFQGRLELEDDDALPPINRRGRRASALPPIDDEYESSTNPALQQLRAAGGAGATSVANPDDDITAILADEEELCQETFETETLATAEMLRALYDQADVAQCVSEEIMLLKAGLLRQKQLKLFGDLGGEATFEEKYIDAMTARQTERAARRQAMLKRVEAAELEQANLEVRGGSHVARLAARTKVHEDTMTEHFRFFDSLRDMTFRGSSQQREWDADMLKMEVQRLDLKKAVHVNPYDTEHVQYITYRMQSMQRFGGYSAVIKDLQASDVIAVTRDLQDARVLLARLGRDSLHAELANPVDEGVSHFQREQEDALALGSRRWHSVCELLERNHRMRNEWSADRLEIIRETCRTIKAFETKVIRQWNEEQERNDAAMLKLIEEDKTIIGAHREGVLRDARQAMQERSEIRQSRVVSMQAEHQQLDEDLGMLTSSHDEVIGSQSALLKSWNEARSFDDLKRTTVDYIETLDAGKVPSALSNTVMTRPSTKLAVSLGGTSYLPSWVNSTLELAMFLYQEEMEWFGYHIERLLAERVRFLLRLAARMEQRWLDEITYLANTKAAFRLRRVLDSAEYPSVIPTAGFLDREIMKQRLEGLDAAKAKLQRTLEWRDESLLEAQQFIESEGRAMYELRIVLSRIFEVERTFRDRHIALQLKWCRLAQHRRTLDRIKLLAAEAAGDTPAESKKRNAIRESRIQEVQNRRMRIQAEEAARREADRLRSEQLAAQKQEAMRRQKDQLAFEQRKKLLEASEARQKERLRKEREERERWHQEFLRQEQERKRELEEKRAWTEYRKQAPKALLEAGGPRVRRGSQTATPSDSPVNQDLQPAKKEQALAPAPKLVRRKSTDGTTTPTAKPPVTFAAQPAKKPATKPSAKVSKPASKPARDKMRKYVPLDSPVLSTEGSMSPHESVKLSLQAKYRIGDLNTSTAQRDFATFSDRKQYYLAEHMSNRDIYTKQCKTHNVAPDADFLFNLSDEPLLFKMTSVTFSNRAVHLASVLDVILFNPIQHLYLRKCGLKQNDVQQLCEALAHCAFLSHVDLRNNDLDDNAGAAILSLVKLNHKITKVDLDGNQIADYTLNDISMTCESNAFGRDIGRSEFEYIRSVFAEMDTDGSGVVTLQELRAFAEREKKKKPDVLSPNTGSTRDRMNATVEKRVRTVRQHLCSLATKQGTGDFSLADLICFIFPHWSVQDADAVVAKYSGEADSGPTLPEMEEFMETFGRNGTLSLQQLATGLNENVESLRTVFGEYDVDNDGKLSLEEFMRFMSA